MRIASITPAPIPTTAPTMPAPEQAPEFEKAVMYLDWAHETAGSATSDPDYVEAGELLSAADNAKDAATLLGTLGLTAAVQHALDASNALDSAATAKLHEDPDVASGVIQARGEDAEQAIHDAFTAIGLDGRGE